LVIEIQNMQNDQNFLLKMRRPASAEGAEWYLGILGRSGLRRQHERVVRKVRART
jgi:hypothetical protein